MSNSDQGGSGIHGEKIYRVARSRGLSHHDAEDIVQTIAFKRLQTLAKGKNINCEETWINGALRYTLADYFRKQKQASKHSAPLTELDPVDEAALIGCTLHFVILQGLMIARSFLPALPEFFHNAGFA